MSVFWSPAQHLAWPFFAMLVATGLIFLILDYVWRVWTIRTVYLLALFVLIWLGAMTLIAGIFYVIE